MYFPNFAHCMKKNAYKLGVLANIITFLLTRVNLWAAADFWENREFFLPPQSWDVLSTSCPLIFYRCFFSIWLLN